MFAIRNNQTSRARFWRCAPAMVFIAACLIFSQAFSAVSRPAEQEKKARDAQREKNRSAEKDSASEKDQPVRLHSDLVVVNVTATDSAGGYARGLGAKDFNLLEDSAPQSINSFFAEEAPFAAAILVDMSGSMEYKFGLVRGAAASFIEHIGDNDQVAVFGFNNKVRLFQDFTNSRYITDYIWDAKAEDMTRLYDCLDEAIDALEKRDEKRRAALLISDGWDSASRAASLNSTVKKALSAGVTIYAIDLIEDEQMIASTSVSIMLRRGRKELQGFAEQTGGRYVHSPHGDKLEEDFINIVDELHNQYTLTYYSTNEKRDGRWRKLTVNALRPGLSVRARRGYYAPKS